MIDVAAIEGLEAIEQLALFVFAFVDDDQYVAELSERMGKAEVILLPDEDVDALCQRLCAAGILRCNQYVWGRPRYKLCGRFSSAGLARLLEISVERTWWRIFGYDDETPRPPTQNVSEFGKDLLSSCGWDCAARAFMKRQLISGRPMAVKYGGSYNEDSI